MFDYTQSEFIESEKFESDFYFEYLSMLKDYEQKQELEKLSKGEYPDIDYNINNLPF
jgi:hypothetical protein